MLTNAFLDGSWWGSFFLSQAELKYLMSIPLISEKSNWSVSLITILGFKNCWWRFFDGNFIIFSYGVTADTIYVPSRSLFWLSKLSRVQHMSNERCFYAHTITLWSIPNCSVTTFFGGRWERTNRDSVSYWRSRGRCQWQAGDRTDNFVSPISPSFGNLMLICCIITV